MSPSWDSQSNNRSYHETRNSSDCDQRNALTSELTFALKPAKPEAPKPMFRARVEKGRLIGTTTTGANKIEWVGVRPPKWGKYDANAKHKFGQPVTLFNGKDMSSWGFQLGKKPSG